MAVLFDTNILFTIARDPSKEQAIRNKVNPGHEQEIISIVVVGELRSLVRQNGWGVKRLSDVEILLQKLVIIRIDSDLLVDRYVEIDVFSQGKHPTLSLPDPTNQLVTWVKMTFGSQQRLLYLILGLSQWMVISTILIIITFGLINTYNR